MEGLSPGPAPTVLLWEGAQGASARGPPGGSGAQTWAPGDMSSPEREVGQPEGMNTALGKAVKLTWRHEATRVPARMAPLNLL